MSFSVEFDPKLIYENIQKSTDVSLDELGEKILEDTEDFVPMKTGALRASAEVTHKDRNGIEITYERLVDGTDITETLYQGHAYPSNLPVKHWTTEGTGGYWLYRAEENYMDSWISYFKLRTREIWRNRKNK